MSETKSKTKMKSGTIAVIALSVVLVLSLITTITLAYFTATRNVITTIQFSNGVTLQMYGVHFKDTDGISIYDAMKEYGLDPEKIGDAKWPEGSIGSFLEQLTVLEPVSQNIKIN